MLDYLPLEVLELILINRSIGHVEIGAVNAVCRRLRHCGESNELWRTKFRHSWPHLSNRIGSTASHWRDLYRRRLDCRRRVRNEVLQMSMIYHEKEELPKDAFRSVKILMVAHQHGYLFVVDELQSILCNSRLYDDLTLKYYAEKVLCFVKNDHLQSAWEDFLKFPPEEQSIEKGAILVAQWFQPAVEIEESSIAQSLNEIASLVVMNLADCHPDHPVVQRWLYPGYFLSESLWSPSSCSQALKAINATLFNELGFCGDVGAYYMPENSFLNRVLDRKMGIPITLCILYMSLARRLGVVCEPVAFPSHFVLRCKDHIVHVQPHTYIDVYNKGAFIGRDELVRLHAGAFAFEPSSFDVVTPLMVFERMARNVIEAGKRLGNMSNGIWYLRNGLELLLILRPDDVEARLLLARIYLNLNINLTEVLSSLQEVLARDPSQTGVVAYMYRSCQSKLSDPEQAKVVVHERPEDGSVTFAVGMIMVHKQYNYTCVIHGWDSQCSATREWILQMGVHRLPKREFQPFYNVLVEDGSVRYAAQENLVVCFEPKFVEHPEVGRYFSSFHDNHFVPNEQLSRQYPDDMNVLNDHLQTLASRSALVCL